MNDSFYDNQYRSSPLQENLPFYSTIHINTQTNFNYLYQQPTSSSITKQFILISNSTSKIKKMKLSFVFSLFLVLLMISTYVMSAVIPESDELTIVDPESLSLNDENQNEGLIRHRRSCDCWTTTGRCMSYGSYQCYFSGRPSIVQCVGGNRWIRISTCSSSCRSWGNDQPYCS